MPLLSDLIDLPPRPLISIVGAGGKTTTMYTLANELAQRGQRVITTTTTNIYIPRPNETDTLIVAAETPTLLKMIHAAWKQHRRITVAGTAIGSGKLAGLHIDQPYALLQQSGADAVIVEADGARHLMIKAPAEYEPVLPPQTNVALLVMSAEAINQPLSAEIAHRPERVVEVTGIGQGELLTPEAIARLLTSERGAMKDVPDMARAYVLITHVREQNEAATREVATLLADTLRVAGTFCSAQPGGWFGM